ncbi:MAG: family 43 glycosylhydrolase [Paludibacteraceae bacterium]|nr:family 43 glycosylhydrolase [Paludibacteraceae bacterium]
MNRLKNTLGWVAGTLLGLSPNFVLADNPIIQTYYSPDPAPVVIDDTVFVYTGNDEGGSFFTMNGWRVSSSTDMVNWTDRGTLILSSRDFPNAKENGDWAAQVIRRNGKYYYYVTVESSLHPGGRAINVAVADRPEGPFKNALSGTDHLAGPNWDYIDPTVWIDDDGQAYLYWGNPKLFWAKLNEDMISFDGGIHETDMSRGFAPPGQSSTYTEGPWIHKRNGKYYMIYAAQGVPEAISYSWSDSPTGPWEYKGVIMPKNEQGAAFTNHSGLIDFKGRSFFFYHNQRRVPGAGGYNRTAAVEEFTWNADGTIPELHMTDEGVKNPIHFVDPFKRVEAETKAFSYGLQAGKNNNGVYMTKIHNNDYIKVRCLDFGDMGADFFTASVSSKNEASIEVHLDKQDGELIGTLKVENTNGAWRELECEVANTIGKHDLFFVFKGAANTELFDFDYWYFTSNSVIVPQTPYKDEVHSVPGKIDFEDYDVGGQNRAYYDADMENQGGEYREDRVDIVANDEGYAVGYTNEGEWLEYTVDVKKTKEYGFEARVACGLNTSGFQLLLDDKAISGEIEVPNTEDWDTYTMIKGKTSEMKEGEHILRVLLTGAYANLDWIRFIDEESTNVVDVSKSALQFPLQVKVYDMGGKQLGTATLASDQPSEIARQLRTVGYPAETYLLRGKGFRRVVVVGKE